MEPVRTSILNIRPRSANSVSKCTWESAEEQYRREQELIAARARRLQHCEQRLTDALYPTAELMKAQQREILLLQEKATAAQEEARQRETVLEAQRSRKARDEQLDISHMRPWTAATMGYKSDNEERIARRNYTHELASQNLRLMAERSHRKQQQVVQETAKERQAIASEGNFWNLGATNARWIAPEHRHLAPSPPRAARAMSVAASAPTTPRPVSVTPPWATYVDTPRSSRSSTTVSRTGSSSAAALTAAMGALQQKTHINPAMLENYRPQKKHVQPAQQRDGRHPWEWTV